MNKNLKKYREGIVKAKERDEKILLIIPIILGLIGTIAFIQVGVQNLLIFLGFNILLIGFYIQTYDRIKNIEVDNKYLDEEIIKFRDISYKFQELKDSVELSQNNIIQFTPFMATLDYAMKELGNIIFAEQINYDLFKSCIVRILYNTNKVIHYFYRYTQEYLTIALYYYCENTGDFLDYTSFEASKDANPKQKGRIWHITDEAHICYAARHPETDEFIFNNINTELHRPENYHENDDIKYVSSLSIPIFDISGKNVRAVLSLTSNFNSRFDKSHPTNIIDNNINIILVRVFCTIAKIIEICFNRAYPDNDTDIILDILRSYTEENQKLNAPLEQLFVDLTRTSALI